MAEDTREIRYYKGKQYYVIDSNESITHLEEIGKATVKKIVETKSSTLMTLEEHEVWKTKQRSQHVKW